MSACPLCGGGLSDGQRWTFLVYNQGTKELSKEEVIVRRCTACGHSFPQRARQEAVIILPVAQLQELRKLAERAKAELEYARRQVQALALAKSVLEENLRVLALQGRVMRLEGEVEGLKAEKRELEVRLRAAGQ
ncbi:MAG: hypothetical protein C4339_01725 [Nitrososphaerota archaeon]